MSEIYDKDGVTKALELASRVMREMALLPRETLEGVAVRAGCLMSDLEALESVIDECKTVVEDDLHHSEGYYAEHELRSHGYIHESEINCKDNFELVLDAVRDLHRADSDDQEKLILAVLKAQDAITEATELSALLHKTDLQIRCIDTDTLESVLGVLRNPFNLELAEEIHGQTNEIGF